MSVPVRDAATVMLVRDALDPLGGPAIEVCMLRRNLAAEFVAGAYVFPGGSVDPEDRGPEAEALCDGLSDATASEILGVESGGLAFWVAALRECFEEAGVLLARATGDPGGTRAMLDFGDRELAERFSGHRRQLNDRETRLLDICRAEGLELAPADVRYVSHWITPELAPKRFDTRFFVAAAPPGQVARHDDSETIATIWVRPADALARDAAGEIELMPPTVANLGAIEPFRSTEEVMEWAREVTEVPAILPIVLIEDGHLLVLRPGDPGYAEALEDRLASGEQTEGQLADSARAAFGPKPSPA